MQTLCLVSLIFILQTLFINELYIALINFEMLCITKTGILIFDTSSDVPIHISHDNIFINIWISIVFAGWRSLLLGRLKGSYCRFQYHRTYVTFLLFNQHYLRVHFYLSLTKYKFCLSLLENFMTNYRIVHDRERMILGWKESECTVLTSSPRNKNC